MERHKSPQHNLTPPPPPLWQGMFYAFFGIHQPLILKLCDRITKRIALDCEMVGVGSDAKRHMLARVSIVNSHGRLVYDSFVAPQEKVVDYRTHVSGIRPENLKNGQN